MAFRDAFRNVPLLLRTVRGTFDLSGRSRRTELAYWYLAFMAVNVVFHGLITDRLSGRQVFLADLIGGTLFLLPLFALSVRRVHDHSHSGWWVLLLVLLVGIQVYDLTSHAVFLPDGTMDRQKLPGPLTAMAIILLLAVFAMLAAPETIGPNRYGPDPREGA